MIKYNYDDENKEIFYIKNKNYVNFEYSKTNLLNKFYKYIKNKFYYYKNKI